MSNRRVNILKTVAEESVHFFAPKPVHVELNSKRIQNKRTAVLIPTHGPSGLTYNLIKSILKWHPNISLVVIDDCTPETKANLLILNKIKRFAKANEHLTYLRTATNELKAGALNYGIDYVMSLSKKPEVIFTFDDDVIITNNTIPQMIATLYSERSIGAVCSEVRVINKNKNLLTRIQALEYHNFNITKIADNGLLKGPLVMQGMLTAFRVTALKQIKGFSKGHLIEDYEITARLKTAGWKVKIAQKAEAWTHVPETAEALWRQRVRWVSGGLQVLGQYWKKTVSVYQDLLGHMFFASLFIMIMLSFVFVRDHESNPALVMTVLAISLFNFLVSFIFNVASLVLYKDADRQDWLLKLTILPELIYSNILSLILLGSYIFLLYSKVFKPLANRISLLSRPYNWGLEAFNKAGFSTRWGTRNS